ncbi:MAG TPA: zinc transporter ZupT [Candidatus Kapabacteria bacterium]|nr:zinc transporter ZupT [Candidatus Kapabacteria bacterium]HPO63804.1 zinc transporter ZupT [Candidatus Kapabacteria bacterium]
MEYSTSNILFALALTTFAGLSTGIGSAMAFFAKKTSKRFLSASLGFSAGVMIYVSFVEIMTKSKESLIMAYNDEFYASAITLISFLSGIFFILIIDRLIPKYENPHEPKTIEEMNQFNGGERKLFRMGIFVALAIAIHNFPEGLATFTAALQEPTIGISIALAIAIHNIPEGIAVSVPVYYATGNKKKAFWLSFTSGLAEPVGGIVGFLLLLPFINGTTMGIVFGFVAGIMVFISLDELLPSAREYDSGHYAIYGMIAGMVVMGGSLLLFI